MSKSHKNDRNFFPKFNLYQLQQYAEIWAEKFSILQIEKITLYRVSSLVFEGAIKKYALVFEYSGVQDPDAIDYGCQEFGLQPLESYPIDSENPFITALKEIKHADQFASQGRHRLFDSFFVNTVYREKPSGDGDYFREWTYILRPSGSKDPLPRGVLAGRLYWILYPDSGASDALQSTEITKTEPDLDVFKEKKIFPCKPGTKWDDVKITLTGDDTVRIKTPQGEGVFSYHQLELADRRIPKGKATILWTLLESFAKNNGFISPNTDDYDPKLPDNAKRLNKHLQKLFGIKESIYTDHYKKLKKPYVDPEIYTAQDEQTATKSQRVKGYRTKIFFSDQTKMVF